MVIANLPTKLSVRRNPVNPHSGTHSRFFGGGILERISFLFREAPIGDAAAVWSANSRVPDPSTVAPHSCSRGKDQRSAAFLAEAPFAGQG